MAKKVKKRSYVWKEKIILGSVFGTLIVGIVAFLVIYSIMNNYLIKIDGVTVGTNSEFKTLYYENAYVYSMYGINLNDVTQDGYTYRDLLKNDALNTMIQSHIMALQAGNMNIGLTEEQTAKVPEDIAKIKENYGADFIKETGATDSDIKTIVENGYLSQNLFDEVTKDYTRDEVAFTEFFDGYVEDNKTTLTKYDVEYVKVADEEAANAARERILAGEDYATLYKEVSTDYTAPAEGEEEKEIVAVDLEGKYFGAASTDAAYVMSVGDVSEPIEVTDGYLVFKLVNKTEPDLEGLRATKADEYDNNQKQTLMQTAYAEWELNYDVKVNDKMFADLLNTK